VSGSGDTGPQQPAHGEERSPAAARLYVGLGAATILLFAILAVVAGVGPAH